MMIIVEERNSGLKWDTSGEGSLLLGFTGGEMGGFGSGVDSNREFMAWSGNASRISNELLHSGHSKSQEWLWVHASTISVSTDMGLPQSGQSNVIVPLLICWDMRDVFSCFVRRRMYIAFALWSSSFDRFRACAQIAFCRVSFRISSRAMTNTSSSDVFFNEGVRMRLELFNRCGIISLHGQRQRSGDAPLVARTQQRLVRCYYWSASKEFNRIKSRMRNSINELLLGISSRFVHALNSLSL